MRNKKYILWLVSIVFLTLYSCSDDKGDGFKLLKKVVATSADGTLATTLFIYDGNEIVSIDDVQKHTNFTYKDGLISKTVTLDKTNQLSETIEYTYVKGELVRVNSLDNYTINYIHNSDKTVFYEKLVTNLGNQQVKLFHGILYFQNGNFIKDERILDNTISSVLSKYSISFGYDSKHNPLYNISGYKKLLDYDEAISANNTLLRTVTESISQGEQITSSANFYKNSFTYDLEDYPIEQISENGNAGYLKTVYFY